MTNRLATLLTLAACSGGTTDPGTTSTGDTASPATPQILTAGRQFGECVGTCTLRVQFDGADLVFEAGEYDLDTVDVTNLGTLTAAGLSAYDAALADLAARSLEETYGCPDCADGGASTMTLAHADGTVSEHTWEYGNPPEDLLATDPLLQTAIDALARCEDAPEVTVSAGCTAVW